MAIALINYRLLILVILILLTAACREDIIEPDTFVGTVNEPVQINRLNSYTFIIHAQNMSVNVINNTYIASFTSRISITIVDHSSGYVSINVIDREENSRFSYFGNEDENLFTESIIGYVPSRIGIRAVDFSGKLKIVVTKTL
ncbi:MAG: hypothetical protein JSW63_00965 [Ignavibacterium sp.]|nr:MAG: hypothetical protein JSW63_00965 [Ignavibacterium sp.]